jgi:hypothetical protein
MTLSGIKNAENVSWRHLKMCLTMVASPVAIEYVVILHVQTAERILWCWTASESHLDRQRELF